MDGEGLASLVDPLQKAVTIYRQGRAPERLHGMAENVGEGPVAGFVLPLDRIFRSSDFRCSGCYKTHVSNATPGTSGLIAAATSSNLAHSLASYVG